LTEVPQTKPEAFSGYTKTFPELSSSTISTCCQLRFLLLLFSH